MVLKGISGIVILVLILLISPGLYSEDAGFKYLKNYSYGEYDHQPQNWGMVQADNGIIYVANQGGVLEFDGVSWRIIYVPNNIVRSLAVDKEGTIYIGGIGEIGYLTPDSQGTLEYVSLVDQMEDRSKNFADVWDTHAANEGVYFGTINTLYRCGPRRIKEWEPGYLIYGTYFCKGELFVYLRDAGLMKMVNDGLELIPGGEKFAAAKKIFMIVPYDSRRLLIGTRPDGFFIHDGKTMVPFSTEADDYLDKKKVYQGIRLSNGDLALATRLGGLVIIDSGGHLKHIFDKTYGIQDENVKYVFEDKQGNLWLCLEKGISKIEYASPVSIHDERSGLSGLALSVVKHNNKIYVGSTSGLYYLESRLKFRLIPGIYYNCWSLLSIENSILAAASEGVFQVDTKNNTKRKVIKGASYALLPSKHHPGRVWCGTRSGFVALTGKNGQWIEEHRFEKVYHDIRFIAEDQTGNLWLITSTGGVIKVDFQPDINHAVFAGYTSSHGLPEGGVDSIGVVAGHVIFATKNGIFRFNREKKKFIPDETLGKEFAGGRPVSKPVFRLVEDKNKNIWFTSESRNYQAIPRPGGTFSIYSTPFLRIPMINQVNVIYPTPDGKTIWFGGSDGLFRYDKTVKKDYRQDFSTNIRKVLVNDRLIFDGCKNRTNNADKDLFPIFEYRHRDFYFEFAALFFEAESETLYQCFLEGYDKGWSTWNKDTKRNYTNLDSGMYSFRVRARNVYGHTGREDFFHFKILPPWYRTWWATLVLAIMFSLMLLFTIRMRLRALEREKQRLERIIKERTKDVNDKNQEMEKKTLQLKD